VIPAPFEYVRPATLSEAIELLARHGDDAKILAGGHSLLPAMKLRLAQPKVVIDIGRLPDLRFIRKDGQHFAIGALTTHYEIETSTLLQEGCPLMPEVAASIADVQVRNRGTIGGSLVHADPAGDWAAAVLALDAEMEIAGAGGRRSVAARDFFTDLFQSAVGRNEILTAIRVPATGKRVAYEKFANKASGFAICGVAVVSSKELAIGVTGVATRPYRAASVDKLTDGVEVLSDLHASGDFRAHLARVHAMRAVERAMKK
jgi:carbon-monoxide dehydrogenase medium subunit